MGGLIDDLAKALASGVSRREALAGLVAGAALVRPWTSDAKKGRKKKKKKKKAQSTQPPPAVPPPPVHPPSPLPFAKLQGLCDQWCRGKFSPGTPAATSC